MCWEDGKAIMVHPMFCVAKARIGEVVKRLRRGRRLCWPRRWVENKGCRTWNLEPGYNFWGGGSGGEMDYTPTMQGDAFYGDEGKVDVIRTNPMMGTTNPVAQCTLRCNVDTQCMDRVFYLFARILPDVKRADVAFGHFCKIDADASDALKDGHCVERSSS